MPGGRGVAPKSVDTYEATIDAVKSRFVGIRVGETTAGLIDEILNGIRRDHGATRERHTKVALNSVLTDAVLAGAIAASPIRELGLRRKRKSDSKVKGAPALGVHQVRALLTATSESELCSQKELRDPVIMLAATGVRRSELLALRWEDVDLDGRILTVGGSVVRLKGRALSGRDASKGAAQRSVPLPQFAVDALHRRKGEVPRPKHGRCDLPVIGGHAAGPGQLRQAVPRGSRVARVAGRVFAQLPQDCGHAHRRQGVVGADRGRPTRPRASVDDSGCLHEPRSRCMPRWLMFWTGPPV